MFISYSSFTTCVGSSFAWSVEMNTSHDLGSVSDSAVVARFVAEVRLFHRATVDR